MKKVYLLSIFFITTLITHSQKIELVKDINQRTDNSNPYGFTTIKETTYFFASKTNYEFGLWKKNGDKVEFVKKLPNNVANITLHNDLLYFTTKTGDGYHNHLWQSDGTEEGTKKLNDNSSESIFSLVSFKDKLFFLHTKNYAYSMVAYGNSKTDTLKLGDITINRYYADLTIFNNSIYFIGSSDIYKTDYNLEKFTEINFNGSSIAMKLMDTLNNRLYFSSGIFPSNLYGINKNDSIEKIVDTGNLRNYRAESKRINNTIYFTSEKEGIDELWKTDGTKSGTEKVKSFGESELLNFSEFDDKLYFITRDENRLREIWFYDNETVERLNFNDLRFFNNLSGDGKKLYFSAFDNEHGNEMWEYDGSEIKFFKDINTYSGSSLIRDIFKFNDKLFFTARNGIKGREFWSSDGTTEGTSFLKDINQSWNSSNPSEVAILGDKFFFSAQSKDHGNELWVSDGSKEGTKLFKEFSEGKKGSYISFTMKLNDKIYFTAPSSKDSTALWESDGTENGTKIVKKNVNIIFNESVNHIAFNGKLYFSAYNSYERDESDLWVTDGTPDNTKLLKKLDTSEYNFGSYPAYFTELNNKFYFQCQTLDYGTELWESDGTVEGTKLLVDLIKGRESSQPIYLKKFKNKIFFSAMDSTKGVELWVTDGTKEGTKLFKDINLGEGSSHPSNFTVYNDSLYFQATDKEHGTELWVTDGTKEGTKLVMDIIKGSYGSFPSNLIVLNDKLYLSADNGVSGRELMVLSYTNNENNKDVLGLELSEIIKKPVILYPNPAQSYCVIKSKVDGKFSLTNLSGKVLINGNTNTKIQVDFLPKGIYPIKVNLNNGTTFETKLLKN